MKTNNDTIYQMFEETKELIQQLNNRLDIMENLIYKDDQESFRAVLALKIEAVDYAFREITKNQSIICNAINSMTPKPRIKWWKQIFKK